ncbi:tetratricopeptide repeat protein [Epilithonimonas xixisoli]|uniref:Tetratricopeptide repeat protein n=2 Tax=Epilithonimonas xixisoli TaxID=1476462 RepID=A0A4R8I522_9FLAO|nr:tetratricopeptide repeat protein [Epilithonimonas xixisoli]
MNLKLNLLLVFLILLSCSQNDPVIKQMNTNDSLYYEKAIEYRDNKNLDSAFFYFYKAKETFLKSNDSFGAGKCLINAAIILNDKGDYFGSQETGLDAIKYFNKSNSSHQHYLGTNYNNLGITSSKINEYKQAIEFYKLAIDFSDSPLDTKVYLNNKANAYRKNKEYKNALNIYQKILMDNSVKNDKDFARTITNIAENKFLQNPNYNPVPEFKKALRIRLKEKDNWGLNSSYAHLADYYIENQKDSALVYARKMLLVAKEIKSPDDQVEALQKLISLEDANHSKQYFKAYQKLNDSLQTARSKAKNQFALVRYETEKNKADFLKAQAEGIEKENHIITQYVFLSIALLVIIGLYLYLNRRKKIHQQEKLLGVKNTELKYSKKVHDRVANRIYQILSQVENTENIDRDALLFNLENVYETSRDISYENADVSETQNFRLQLSNMLRSYASERIKIFITGNEEEIWQKTNHLQKTEIYLILQELMTNMKKHSKAEKVFIKFSDETSVINIAYIDNGIGIQQLSKKNGLQNTENRINTIHGTITFDTETNRLLKINISFPI